MSELGDKIRSRAHWDTTIRPAAFKENRVPYGDLERIITGAVARFRGWPVPMISTGEPLVRGQDWIGQDVDAEIVSHFEAWRFWTSGQLVHLRAVDADWREGGQPTPAPKGFDGVIEVWEILFYLTELLELAARLALTDAGGEEMVISATLHGLENRALVVGQRNRHEFFEPLRSQLAQQSYEISLGRDALVSDPRGPAAGLARDFLMRFGLEPSFEQLAEHQRELTDS